MGYRWAREQVDEANTAATTYGGADAVVQAATAGPAAMPGAPVIGPLGAVFSGLGLGGNLAEMYDTGFTPENVVDASGNAAGVLSGIAGLAGSTTVAPAAATYAAVVSLLRGGEGTIAESGFLGKKNPEYENPRENRRPTDLAADEGREARERMRTVTGNETFAQIYGGAKTLEAIPGVVLMDAGAGAYSAAETQLPPIARTGSRLLRGSLSRGGDHPMWTEFGGDTSELLTRPSVVGIGRPSREEPLLEGIGEQIRAARGDR